LLMLQHLITETRLELSTCSSAYLLALLARNDAIMRASDSRASSVLMIVPSFIIKEQIGVLGLNAWAPWFLGRATVLDLRTFFGGSVGLGWRFGSWDLESASTWRLWILNRKREGAHITCRKRRIEQTVSVQLSMLSCRSGNWWAWAQWPQTFETPKDVRFDDAFRMGADSEISIGSKRLKNWWDQNETRGDNSKTTKMQKYNEFHSIRYWR
jgi:hypothetical protein